jgi:pimeloyl-ACP methyl ester carboxylesterase
MPYATIRHIQIHYEIIGTGGPWIALAPGGRRGMEGVASLAQRLAAEGYRVLIHDRRNCGASEVSVEGEGSEYEVWADDLHALLQQLKAAPAFVGGSSSGCRLGILLALRHPEAVRGLLLWRVTGGGLAARRLAEKYYGEYIRAAQSGGMAAVCDTEHFRERIAERAANRDCLMRMKPERFIANMTRWNDYFVAGADLPIIGATEAQLRTITAPACIIPGNDNTHPARAAAQLDALLSRSELHTVIAKHYDVDVSPRDEWDAKEDEVARIFVDFLRRSTAATHA